MIEKVIDAKVVEQRWRVSKLLKERQKNNS